MIPQRWSGRWRRNIRIFRALAWLFLHGIDKFRYDRVAVKLPMASGKCGWWADLCTKVPNARLCAWFSFFRGVYLKNSLCLFVMKTEIFVAYLTCSMQLMIWWRTLWRWWRRKICVLVDKRGRWSLKKTYCKFELSIDVLFLTVLVWYSWYGMMPVSSTHPWNITHIR